MIQDKSIHFSEEIQKKDETETFWEHFGVTQGKKDLKISIANLFEFVNLLQ